MEKASVSFNGSGGQALFLAPHTPLKEELGTRVQHAHMQLQLVLSSTYNGHPVKTAHISSLSPHRGPRRTLCVQPVQTPLEVAQGFF